MLLPDDIYIDILKFLSRCELSQRILPASYLFYNIALNRISTLHWIDDLAICPLQSYVEPDAQILDDSEVLFAFGIPEVPHWEKIEPKTTCRIFPTGTSERWLPGGAKSKTIKISTASVNSSDFEFLRHVRINTVFFHYRPSLESKCWRILEGMRHCFVGSILKYRFPSLGGKLFVDPLLKNVLRIFNKCRHYCICGGMELMMDGTNDTNNIYPHSRYILTTPALAQCDSVIIHCNYAPAVPEHGKTFERLFNAHQIVDWLHCPITQNANPMPTYVFHLITKKLPMQAARYLKFSHRESVRLIYAVIELAKQRFLESTDRKHNYTFSFILWTQYQWDQSVGHNCGHVGIDDPVWKALRQDICFTNHITQELLILSDDTRSKGQCTRKLQRLSYGHNREIF